MSTIINQPPPLHQYGLLWVAIPSATFHAKFLDQRLYVMMMYNMNILIYIIALYTQIYNHTHSLGSPMQGSMFQQLAIKFTLRTKIIHN